MENQNKRVLQISLDTLVVPDCDGTKLAETVEQEHITECIKEGYTSGEIVTEENESYTAFIYEEDGITTADLSTYDDEEEAVEFAKSHNWDEVVNDITGEVVWER